MSLTRKIVEQRLEKNRKTEAKVNLMRRCVTETNLLISHGQSEQSVERARIARQQTKERQELFMDYGYVQAKQDQHRRQQITEAEDRIATELASRNASKTREAMEKQRICNGSEELRQLKERLHAAKVNKDRAQQLLDLEVRKDKDRRYEHFIDEYMNNERLEHQELAHKLDLEKGKQRERVKVINQQQMALKEAMREESNREYLKERDNVNELVEQIAREDAQEQAARRKKSKESQELLTQFMVQQKQKQVQMEQDEIEENNKIEAFAQKKREFEAQLERKKQEAEAEKLRIFQSQLSKAEERNRGAAEFEYLRNELYWEEAEAQKQRREELEVRKRLEDREEMKQAFVFQMEMKERVKAMSAAEEGVARQEYMAQCAEDARLEQVKDEKRRKYVEDHKRESQRIIDARRQMYEQAREAEREEGRELHAEEVRRAAVIEEERQRLLREYAVPLRDFLPKATCMSKTDQDIVFPAQALASLGA